MRTFLSALALLVLIFGLTVGQKNQTAAKRKTVSGATVSSMPAGKSYEVDLRNKGTVYDFNGNGTDFSRVTVRTTSGIKTMADLLKESKSESKGKLTVGIPADLRGIKLNARTVGAGRLNFTCSGLFCGCSGDADCNDMFSGAACGPIAWCNLDTGKCYCVARA